MNDKNKQKNAGDAAAKPKSAKNDGSARKAPPAPGKPDDKIRVLLLNGCTAEQYAKACGIERGSALVRLKQGVEKGVLEQTTGESEASVLDTLLTVGSASRKRPPQVFKLKVAAE